jgi:hypothetical protein
MENYMDTIVQLNFFFLKLKHGNIQFVLILLNTIVIR